MKSSQLSIFNLSMKKYPKLYPKLKHIERVKPIFGKSQTAKLEEILENRQYCIQLFHAVQNGFLDYIQSIDSKMLNIFVNLKFSEQSFTLLHEAAHCNKPEILEFLLSLRCNINAKAIKNLTPLHLAVKSKSFQSVKILCNYESLIIDSVDSKGQTALDIACRMNNYEISQILLENGADPNKKEIDGVYCLHHAIRSNNLELIKLLIRYKCIPNDKDNNGISPLDISVNNGNVNVFIFCLNSIKALGGNIPSILNSRDNEGYSCLLNSIRQNKEEIMRYCLEYGADLNIVQNDEKTALHIAVENGHIGIVDYLYNIGFNIDAVDVYRNTALHLAIYMRNVELIEYLLQKGTTVNICNSNFETPLLLLLNRINNFKENDQMKIIESLLYMKSAVEITDIKKRNCLHLLIENKKLEGIKLLFKMSTVDEHFLLMSSTDYNGNTPLNLASSQGCQDICQFLIENGASLYSTNNVGHLPIHIAIMNGNLNLIIYFLQVNEDQLHFKNDNETDLILFSIQSGQYKVFEYLFQLNVDRHCKDESGNDIFITACKMGHINIASYVLNHDFNILIRNHILNTGLHEASSEGHTKMIKFLISKGAVLTENIYKQTPLNLALNNHHWEAVNIFMNDSNWKKTMEFRFQTGKTHLDDLIINNEDITCNLLDRGISLSQDDKFNEDLNKLYHFSLIDGGPDDSESINKRYHGLITMAKFQKAKLLRHPLTTMLIKRKWERCAKYFYILDVSLYICFLILITFLICLIVPSPTDNDTSNTTAACININNTTMAYKMHSSGIASLNIGIYCIILCRIYIEFMKMHGKPRQYFKQMDSYTFIALYSLTSLFIWNPLYLPCTDQWNFGIFAIFLAWWNLMYYFRSMPVTGMLTLMFQNVVQSVIKIQFAFLNIMIGFAIVFNIVNRVQVPFSGIDYSYVKVINMLIGEMDYVTSFVDPTGIFPLVKSLLSILFIIAMPISLANLMVGVAVGDIDKMMKMAKLNLAKSRIEYIYDVELIIPRLLDRRLYEPVYVKKCKRSLESKLINENIEDDFQEITDRLSNIEKDIQIMKKSINA